MTEPWIIVVPALVTLGAALFIDHGSRRLRIVGYAVGILGAVSMFTCLYVVLEADAAERAECVSRGGVPNDGDCWIDGERLASYSSIRPGSQATP